MRSAEGRVRPPRKAPGPTLKCRGIRRRCSGERGPSLSLPLFPLRRTPACGRRWEVLSVGLLGGERVERHEPPWEWTGPQQGGKGRLPGSWVCPRRGGVRGLLTPGWEALAGSVPLLGERGQRQAVAAHAGSGGCSGKAQGRRRGRAGACGLPGPRVRSAAVRALCPGPPPRAAISAGNGLPSALACVRALSHQSPRQPLWTSVCPQPHGVLATH